VISDKESYAKTNGNKPLTNGKRKNMRMMAMADQLSFRW
jgi:hypothetical protein